MQSQKVEHNIEGKVETLESLSLAKKQGGQVRRSSFYSHLMETAGMKK